MPYKRNKSKRVKKRKPRASSWYNKRYSVAQLAGKAWSGVKYIKGLVNSEMYSLENSASGSTISTTPTVIHITATGSGDGESNRTGNSIYVKSYFIRGGFVIDPDIPTSFVRMVIVRDTQQVGDTAPAFNDVFSSNSCFSVVNDTTKGRFDILCDRVYTLDNSGKRNIAFKCYIPMRSHVRYNGTATTDIQRNGLYLMFISDQPTDTVSYSYGDRLRYHDN